MHGISNIRIQNSAGTIRLHYELRTAEYRGACVNWVSTLRDLDDGNAIGGGGNFAADLTQEQVAYLRQVAERTPIPPMGSTINAVE